MGTKKAATKTPAARRAAAKKQAPKRPAAKKPAKKPKKQAARKAVPQQNPTPAKKVKGANSASKQDRFVQEYLIDLNGTQAAVRAGYSPNSARDIATELMAKPDIQTKIADAMDRRAERCEITSDAVLKRLWGIATADARELVELHRGCCRFCYGTDNHYQRTPRELADAIAEHEDLVELAVKLDKRPPRGVDTRGGTGWNPVLAPNPKCPECHGRGAVEILPRDTRDLSPAGQLLFAGIKQTQNGLEIKSHDQTGMLVRVGDHLGMFKRKVELTGKDGKPMQHETTIGNILDDLSDAGGDTGPGPSS